MTSLSLPSILPPILPPPFARSRARTLSEVDAEGHDGRVIEGAAQTLRAKKVRYLELEYIFEGAWKQMNLEQVRVACACCLLLEQARVACCLLPYARSLDNASPRTGSITPIPKPQIAASVLP